jgi:hypothetical protein
MISRESRCSQCAGGLSIRALGIRTWFDLLAFGKRADLDALVS